MKLHKELATRALQIAVKSSKPGAGFLAATLLTGLTGKLYFTLSNNSKAIANHEVCSGLHFICINCRAIDLKLDAAQESSPFAGVQRKVSLRIPHCIGEKLLKDIAQFNSYEDANRAVRELLKTHQFAPHVTWHRLALRASKTLQKEGLVSAQLYGSQTDTSYSADDMAVIKEKHQAIISRWIDAPELTVLHEEPIENHSEYWGTQGLLKHAELKQVLNYSQSTLNNAQLDYAKDPSFHTRIALHNAHALRTSLIWHLATASRPLIDKAVRASDIDWNYQCASLPNKSRLGTRVIPLCSTAISALSEYERWCESLTGTMAKLVTDSLNAKVPLFGLFNFKGLSVTYTPLVPKVSASIYFQGVKAPSNWSRKTTIDYLWPYFHDSPAFDAFIDHNKAQASVSEMKEIADVIDSWLIKLME
ncbi:hypothetical protein AAOGI_38650 [Agarivorans albus]